MKKNIWKKKILILIILVSVGLSGCASTVTLTDKENSMVAEYMAGLILKYDKDYEDELQSKDSDNEKDQQEVTDTQNTDVNQKDTNDESIVKTKNFVKLASVMNQKNFTIAYSKYSFCNKYPNNNSNSYFTLEPSTNKKFLVVEFSIKNKTKKQSKINMISSTRNYQLEINNGTLYSPSVTLLLNDIQTINRNIKAGKKVKAVILFEVPKDINVKDINLYVTDKSKTALVNIK